MSIQKFVAAVALSGLAFPALAENQVSIFGAIGQADHKVIIVSDSDTSFGLGAAYSFNENFSGEFRFDDFGSLSGGDEYDSYEFSVSSMSIGLNAGIPLNEQFDLYAKIGLAFWSGDAESTERYSYYNGDTFVTETEYESASEDGNDFYFGFGGKYKFNDQWAMGLEYVMLDADVDGISYEVDNLSLQLALSF